MSTAGGSGVFRVQVLERLASVPTAVTTAERSNALLAVLANLPAGPRRAAVVVWNCRPGSSDVSEHGWRAGGPPRRRLGKLGRLRATRRILQSNRQRVVVRQLVLLCARSVSRPLRAAAASLPASPTFSCL